MHLPTDAVAGQIADNAVTMGSAWDWTAIRCRPGDSFLDRIDGSREKALLSDPDQITATPADLADRYGKRAVRLPAI